MDKELIIKKLKKGNILSTQFDNLCENNKICFSKEGISVIYAPNGTGKTTISNIFQGEKYTEIEATYNGVTFTSMPQQQLFHVINDQISRNIIEGSTDEFVLGENIAKERHLKDELDKNYTLLFDKIKTTLKTDYQVTQQSTSLIEAIKNKKLKNIISTLGKRGAKTTDIKIDDLISLFSEYLIKDIPEYDEDCLKFYLTDMVNKPTSSIIKNIQNVVLNEIGQTKEIRTIKMNQTAIKILKKYQSSTCCIVCDTQNIDPITLIRKKTENNELVISTLSSETKKILDSIVSKITDNDPFNIYEILTTAIESGDIKIIENLILDFSYYQKIVETKLINDIIKLISQSKIKSIYSEYKELLDNKLELFEDDEILIKDIIADSLGRNVLLERDEQKNIIIKLDEAQLIGTHFNDLHLSTGEQNFISLAFELLKAKNSKNPIIVMDDPISSFDSIYKNKIAYCIVKILEKKQQIIFTHNIELVRLLDVQKTHCFNLYLLSNDSSEKCGFIPVNQNERNLILYFDKLLDLLRSKDIDIEINDKRTYMMSLIPFMRAIIKIVNPNNKKDCVDKLTSLMHGYCTDVVNITPIYNILFDKEIKTNYEISAQDIVSLNIKNLDFIKDDNYPLLAKTLRHTLLYLYLRLNVEKTLREKFPNKTKRCELLGDFIYKSLNEENFKSERIRLTSKKTLLNEFNHYEGNFNIFQPAIDITDTNLEKEKEEILKILEDIKSK